MVLALNLPRRMSFPGNRRARPPAPDGGYCRHVDGEESYWVSADGFLIPAKKDQAPPDLR